MNPTETWSARLAKLVELHTASQALTDSLKDYLKAEARAAVRAGVTRQEIADALGITNSTLGTWLKK